MFLLASSFWHLPSVISDPQFFPVSVHPVQYVPMHLPHDPAAAWAAEIPDSTAIRAADATWTWRDLHAAVNRAAGWLDRSAPEGAVVVLQGWNEPAFIALREAIYRTGRTYAAVSPQATEEEVRHVLRLTGAAVFLRAGDLPTHGIDAVPFDEPFQGPAVDVPDRRAQARTLLLTSGTTGLPKACVRPVKADLVRMESMVRNFNLRPEQTHLTATPLYHSGPTIFQRTHLALGSTTVLHRKFYAEDVWDAVAAGDANTAFFVPTHFHRLLRDDTGVSADRIETWWMAGAPASSALKERVIERIGPGRLWEFLGSSETGTMAIMPPDGHLAHRGSVGKPPAGVEVRIVDEAGNDLPPNEIGTLYVRSGMLMTGYLGDDAPAAQWRDGFLSVGDLGYVDAEGYVYLADRRTDLIISGGVNVYPAEVEAVLEAHPHIHEACVVGEPDEEWGSRVVAVIVESESVSDDDILAFVRQRLSPAKRPKRIVRRSALPHNAIGKPLRSEVRKEI